MNGIELHGIMLDKVISGAQTGVDRAALDVALELGIPCGGWVPKGRLAEDGIVPAHYPNLMETPTSVVEMRTEWNIRDSDATLLLSHGPLEGGSLYTKVKADEMGKPWLHIDFLDYRRINRRVVENRDDVDTRDAAVTRDEVNKSDGAMERDDVTAHNKAKVRDERIDHDEAIARDAAVTRDEAISSVTEWLSKVRPRILNVAGPRASKDPEIYETAYHFLRYLLGSRFPGE